ncbi:hypothetical protein PR048_010772 [Dryococelus australis]|uniref:Uncharacterized protein n=1 Tax=Dryococelus australis TaxID=614101 RepID=A0ABQ9I3N6_9NEOP|nr:hypothetical protein PR048_010772 [Dryococelus australis]
MAQHHPPVSAWTYGGPTDKEYFAIRHGDRPHRLSQCAAEYAYLTNLHNEEWRDWASLNIEVLRVDEGEAGSPSSSIVQHDSHMLTSVGVTNWHSISLPVLCLQRANMLFKAKRPGRTAHNTYNAEVKLTAFTPNSTRVRLRKRGRGGLAARLLTSHQGEPGSILAPGNRAGRCLWSVCFLKDLPFPLPLHSGAAPYSPPFTLIGLRPIHFTPLLLRIQAYIILLSLVFILYELLCFISCVLSEVARSGGPGFDFRSGHPDFGFPWFREKKTPGECWGWVPNRFLPNPSPLPLPCEICTASNDLAVDETLSPLNHLKSVHSKVSTFEGQGLCSLICLASSDGCATPILISDARRFEESALRFHLAPPQSPPSISLRGWIRVFQVLPKLSTNPKRSQGSSCVSWGSSGVCSNHGETVSSRGKLWKLNLLPVLDWLLHVAEDSLFIELPSVELSRNANPASSIPSLHVMARQCCPKRRRRLQLVTPRAHASVRDDAAAPVCIVSLSRLVAELAECLPAAVAVPDSLALPLLAYYRLLTSESPACTLHLAPHDGHVVALCLAACSCRHSDVAGGPLPRGASSGDFHCSSSRRRFPLCSTAFVDSPALPWTYSTECGALSVSCNFLDSVKLCLHEAEGYPGSRTLVGLQKVHQLPVKNSVQSWYMESGYAQLAWSLYLMSTLRDQQLEISVHLYMGRPRQATALRRAHDEKHVRHEGAYVDMKGRQQR